MAKFTLHSLRFGVVFLVLTCFGQASVFTHDSLPYQMTRLDGDLLGTTRIDSSTAVAYGNNGIIMITRDRGTKWQQVQGVPDITFTTAAVADKKWVYVFSYEGSILRLSLSSGRYDIPSILNLQRPWSRSCHIDGDLFLLVDTAGAMFRVNTASGKCEPASDFSINKVYAVIKVSASRILAATSAGIFNIGDVGQSWQVWHQASPGDKLLSAESMILCDNDTIVAGFTDVDRTQQKYHISGDGGATWRESRVLGIVGQPLWYSNDSMSVLFSSTPSFTVPFVAVIASMYEKPVVKFLHFDERRFSITSTVTNGIGFSAAELILTGRKKTIFVSSATSDSLFPVSHLNSSLLGSSFPATQVFNNSILTIPGDDEQIVTSRDGGNTWLPPQRIEFVPPLRGFASVLIYNDSVIVADLYAGAVMISTDTGNTFIRRGPYSSYVDICYRPTVVSPNLILKPSDFSGIRLTVVKDSGKTRETYDTPIKTVETVNDSVVMIRSLRVVPFRDIFLGNVFEYARSGNAPARSLILRSYDTLHTVDTLFISDNYQGGNLVVIDSNVLHFYQVGSPTEVSKVFVSEDAGRTWNLRIIDSIIRPVGYRIVPDQRVPNSFTIREAFGRIYLTQDSGITWAAPFKEDSAWSFGLLNKYSSRRCFLSGLMNRMPGLFRVDFWPDSGNVQSVGEPQESPVCQSTLRVESSVSDPGIVRLTAPRSLDLAGSNSFLTVCNLRGELIVDLSAELREAYSSSDGQAVVHWSTSSLSSGLYIVNLRAPGISCSVKLYKAYP
jgi:photosystem II stability/assembly factor-like uncharacterized protein